MTDALPLNSNDRVAILDPSCTLVGSVATCSLGTIAPLATRTVTIGIVPKGKEGYLSNTATVSSSTFDPDTSNNSSTKVVLSGNAPKPVGCANAISLQIAGIADVCRVCVPHTVQDLGASTACTGRSEGRRTSTAPA